MVVPGTYTAKATVDGRSYSQTVTVVPDPRVVVSAPALAAQFQLEQRMVAGITASYHAVTAMQQLRGALAARSAEAANNAAAAQIATALKTLDETLTTLMNGPGGVGTAHRDLARRLNDQIGGDAQPTPSVIAGADAPCRAIDTAMDGLRKLQTTSVADLNALLARASLAALPAWTPPAAPACGPKWDRHGQAVTRWMASGTNRRPAKVPDNPRTSQATQLPGTRTEMSATSRWSVRC